MILLLNYHQFSYYLKKALNIKKGNSTPGRTVIGKINLKQLEEIAKLKMKDLNANNLDGAVPDD